MCLFNRGPSPSSPRPCRPPAPPSFSANPLFVHLSLQLSSVPSHLLFILPLPLNITLIVSFFLANVPLNVSCCLLTFRPGDTFNPQVYFCSPASLLPFSYVFFLTSILSSPSCLILSSSIDNPCRLSDLPYALCVFSHRSLDLTGPLFLGGVPNVPDNFPFGSREFIGCIKEFHIDNKPLDLAGFIANNGTVAG